MGNPPDGILRLVERYHENRDHNRSSGYKEAQCRIDFVDPFFEALGWDISNRRGHADAYREVVVEPSVEVEDARKAPDYCFRVGGTPKFFVEAKRPSRNLKNDPEAAYQLRRYAWSAGLTISVLTNFEEFAIYLCHEKPSQKDKPSAGRVFYCTYEDYAQKWDDISSILSQDAILRGSFDKYAQETKGKRGTTQVDEAFLKEIEAWRDELARNLALRNVGLSARDLNFAVQKTIDRLIFLRICEDRGIERYGQLRMYTEAGEIYDRLKVLFHSVDERYNSGLFHFSSRDPDCHEPSDELTLQLCIDDKVLRSIISSLYYPCPYEFSVLPAEILGHVYERFLGRTIELTKSGRRVRIEDKFSVRKAGGVFYTPTYIVDYIVRQTVGKALEGKTPQTAAEYRIVDPACGSGSFLIGVYQYLLDWHLKWYTASHPEKYAAGRRPALYRNGKGNWRLTTAKRKEILLNNIFGVDIDPQAVEVAKLSLLLKVLEEQNGDVLKRQMELYHERALPDLGGNIKCGNSLVGTDFYEDHQMTLLPLEKHQRVNSFDWIREFTSVFEEGGFDAVIGNPPYVRIQTLKEWMPEEVDYYQNHYSSVSKGNYDLYVVFVERGISLLKQNGRLGFIVPHKFFNSRYGEPLRKLIANGRHLGEVVHFGDHQIFDGATTYTCLLFLDRSGNDKFLFHRVTDLKTWHNTGVGSFSEIKTSEVRGSEWCFETGGHAGLFSKLDSMEVHLRDIAKRMYQGTITSADKVFLFKQSRKGKKPKTIEVLSGKSGEWVVLESSILKPVVRSGNIGSFWAQATAYVLFPYEVRENEARLLTPEELSKEFPFAWDYLNQNKGTLQGREKGAFKDNKWYRFGRTQNLGLWEQPKIMVPYMVTNLSAYLDLAEHLYFVNVTTGGYGVTIDESGGSLAYLCGLLNSNLLQFFLRCVSSPFHGGYIAANKQFIERLPICPINFAVRKDRDRHDRMVDLVTRIQALYTQIPSARNPNDESILLRQIAGTRQQIDQLVYELYGLTDQDIRLLEDVR